MNNIRSWFQSPFWAPTGKENTIRATRAHWRPHRRRECMHENLVLCFDNSITAQTEILLHDFRFKFNTSIMNSFHLRSKKICLSFFLCFANHPLKDKVLFIIMLKDKWYAMHLVQLWAFSEWAIRGPLHRNASYKLNDCGSTVTSGSSLRHQLLWWGVGGWRLGRHVMYEKS